MGLPQDTTIHLAGDSSPAQLLPQSSEELEKKPHKWYYYLWDTLDKPKEERWFMFKLDGALLTFASLGTLNPLPSCSSSANKGRILHQVSRPIEYQ